MARQPVGGRDIPPEIAEHFNELFPEHDDLDDFLQHQECVYESLKNTGSSSIVQVSDSDHSSDLRNLSLNESQSSGSESFGSELDEGIALSLQLMEAQNSLENLSLSESSGTATGDRGASSTETSVMVEASSSDGVDLDNMSYEQLRSLGETIGIQSRGLSAELFSSLPTHKFKSKSGFFSSKKTKNEGCVICFTEYKGGEWLTTLPCMHLYHRECIKPWMAEHKTCPVCNNVVFES